MPFAEIDRRKLTLGLGGCGGTKIDGGKPPLDWNEGLARLTARK
jgi:hypothetical protein